MTSEETSVRDWKSHKWADRSNQRQNRNRIRRERKVDRLAGTYQNVPLNEIEGWVDEDEDDLEFRRTQQEFFLDDLKGTSNLAIQVTGTRWFHSERRIGRIWRAIHRNNISDNKDTILVFRNGDTAVYRLSIQRDKATGLLHSAIHGGCAISKILVNYEEVN